MGTIKMVDLVMCDDCALQLQAANPDSVIGFQPVTGFEECPQCNTGQDINYVLWKLLGKLGKVNQRK
jgi:rubredoxin